MGQFGATALLVGVACLVAPIANAQGAMVPCAVENGYCRVPYATRVFYGVPGQVAALDIQPPGIECSNNMFGDPAPRENKTCSYLARGGGVELQPRLPERGPGRRDEVREQMLDLRQACEANDRRACVRMGIIIGENRARRDQWRREHPEVFFYER